MRYIIPDAEPYIVNFHARTGTTILYKSSAWLRAAHSRPAHPVFALYLCVASLAESCSYRLSFGMVAVRLKASFRLTATIPQGLIK